MSSWGKNSATATNMQRPAKKKIKKGAFPSDTTAKLASRGDRMVNPIIPQPTKTIKYLITLVGGTPG